MPVKLNMVLHNGSVPRVSYSQIISKSAADVKPTMNTSLKSNMIHRVHTATPGCSACGKK
uniref:Uncharacterized protein n=1 Tax=viral metagenome TaxID=1070528 RepID=A0A6C0HAM2_9ZZZZ